MADINSVEVEQQERAAQALIDQAQMKGLSAKDGTATLGVVPPHELVLAWVHAAREMLGEAPNYSEIRVGFPRMEMEIKAAEEWERYVFTLQRVGKTTPHEARQKAEARVTEAHLLLKTFPASRRAIAQEQVRRMRQAAQGQTTAAYHGSFEHNKEMLRQAGASTTLTRPEWEER